MTLVISIQRAGVKAELNLFYDLFIPASAISLPICDYLSPRFLLPDSRFSRNILWCVDCQVHCVMYQKDVLRGSLRGAQLPTQYGSPSTAEISCILLLVTGSVDHLFDGS